MIAALPYANVWITVSNRISQNRRKCDQYLINGAPDCTLLCLTWVIRYHIQAYTPHCQWDCSLTLYMADYSQIFISFVLYQSNYTHVHL